MSPHPVPYILSAVEAGRITEHEADALLRAEHNLTYEQARNTLDQKDQDGSN
jgi:hypothetical protein